MLGVLYKPIWNQVSDELLVKLTLLKHNENTVTPLKQGGDFRSKECIDLLKQADIVCTNPVVENLSHYSHYFFSFFSFFFWRPPLAIVAS